MEQTKAVAARMVTHRHTHTHTHTHTQTTMIIPSAQDGQYAAHTCTMLNNNNEKLIAMMETQRDMAYPLPRGGWSPFSRNVC